MKTDFSIWVHGPEFGSSMVQVPILQHIWRNKPLAKIDLNVIDINKPIFEYYFSDKIRSNRCSIETNKLVHQLVYTSSMNLNLPLTIIYSGKNILTRGYPLMNQFKERVYKKDVSLIVSAGLAEIGIIPKILCKKTPKQLYIFNYLLEYFNFVKSQKVSALIRKCFLKHYNNFDTVVIQTFFPEREYKIKKEVKNLKLIPLIVRSMTKRKHNLRKELGVKKNEKLIFLALGGAEFFKKIINATAILSKEHPSIKFLLLPREEKEIDYFREFSNFVIPKKLSFDTQNYVGASDIVITKCGLSTIAEAIKNRTNIISVSLPNHAEVTETELILKREGIIKNPINLQRNNINILENELYRKILNEIDNKDSPNIMKKIKTNGAKEAAKIYMSFTDKNE